MHTFDHDECQFSTRVYISVCYECELLLYFNLNTYLHYIELLYILYHVRLTHMDNLIATDKLFGYIFLFFSVFLRSVIHWMPFVLLPIEYVTLPQWMVARALRHNHIDISILLCIFKVWKWNNDDEYTLLLCSILVRTSILVVAAEILRNAMHGMNMLIMDYNVGGDGLFLDLS